MTTTEPNPAPPDEDATRGAGRGRWLTIAGVVLATAVTGSILGFAYSGASSYDEKAHRAAVENNLGHAVADWPTIADITKDDCAVADYDLRLRGAMAKDAISSGGDWDAFNTRVLGLQFRCPDRLATFVLPAPAPAYDSAAADRIRRATETAQ